MCICMCVCMYVYVCVYVCVYMYVCMYFYVCMCVCVYVCVYVCMCVYMYVCMCMYVCICLYVLCIWLLLLLIVCYICCQIECQRHQYQSDMEQKLQSEQDLHRALKEKHQTFVQTMSQFKTHKNQEVEQLKAEKTGLIRQRDEALDQRDAAAREVEQLKTQ